MIRFYNSLTEQINNKNNGKRVNSGFSLIELLVVIAIMVVLIGVIAPAYMSYMHKSRVAVDWANLRAYYDEIQADFITTGEYDPDILKDLNDVANWQRTEIEYPDGTTVKMKDGYFAVTKDDSGNGYHIAYYCNKCRTTEGYNKHKDTCILILGATK